MQTKLVIKLTEDDLNDLSNDVLIVVQRENFTKMSSFEVKEVSRKVAKNVIATLAKKLSYVSVEIPGVYEPRY